MFAHCDKIRLGGDLMLVIALLIALVVVVGKSLFDILNELKKINKWLDDHS